MRNSQKLFALICVGAASAGLVNCGTEDDSPTEAAGNAGKSAGSSGHAGSVASGAGAGGARAGAGGVSSAGSAGEATAGKSGGGAGGMATVGTSGGGTGGMATAGTSGGGAGGKAGGGGSGGKAGGGGGGGGGGSGGMAGGGGIAAGGGGSGGMAGGGGLAAGGGGSGGMAGGGAGGMAGGGTSGVGAGGAAGAGAGAGGTAGGGAGGSGGAGGACPAPTNFIDLFDFPNASTINFTGINPSGGKGKWTRSFYGSTPDTLATNGSSAFEAVDGDPTPGSFKAIAPFVGTVGTEKLGLVYNIAPDGAPLDVANLAGRLFTARVRLVTSPHTNCTFVAQAWSTSDISNDGHGYAQKFGAMSPLPVLGTWVTASFDLDQSTDTARINQVGIDIVSTCIGTAVGTGDTVIEVDHATLGCK